MSKLCRGLIGVIAVLLSLNASSAQAQQEAPVAKPLPFKEHLPVPEVTVLEKLEHFQRLTQQRSRFQSDEEAREHLQKVFETIAASTAKMLATELKPAEKVQVTATHFQALVVLDRLDDPRARQPMLELAQKLIEHEDRELAEFAHSQLLQVYLNETLDGKEGAAQKLVEQLAVYAKSGRPTGVRFDTMRTVARGLEIAGQFDQALQAFELMRETFLKSGNLDLIAAADETARNARTRLGLIGKKMSFEGTTVGGEPFDLGSLAGKVVLVNFWATWCQPCVAEMPNIKESYEKFHERGFEVVGISLDEDRRSLEGYLDDAKLPWTTLFSDNTETNQNIFKKFGLEGTPATILVGRDGKVVTLKARGDDLTKELEKLLGPAGNEAPPSDNK